MTPQKLTLALFSILFSLFWAAPAFACGGPVFGDFQLRVLTLSMVAAPVLAALLVDRGAFALGACALGLQRKHRPTAAGPLLALFAVTIALTSVASRDLNVAVAGFAFVPVAAAVCTLSFVRSVLIDMRGQPRAQLLRVAAVAGFVAIALLRVMS
ncbi:MAG: hypothetical protein Q8O67_10150 [Deltaproteobacteria bacterium]|nr:hypothetical protein [Deltaproteobacteria bacterium]